MPTAGDLAAIDEAGRACVTRKLAERGVVFFRLQFCAKSGILIHRLLLALIALEPCFLCHRVGEDLTETNRQQVQNPLFFELQGSRAAFPDCGDNVCDSLRARFGPQVALAMNTEADDAGLNVAFSDDKHRVNLLLLGFRDLRVYFVG